MSILFWNIYIGGENHDDVLPESSQSIKSTHLIIITLRNILVLDINDEDNGKFD